ncbi:MAG: hypothetical protein AAB195_08190, partial [candidate division NC10 bacterium]
MSLPQPESPSLSLPDSRLPESSGTPEPRAPDPAGRQAAEFHAELEGHLVRYFRRQRRLPIIAVRTLLCGLLDFPIVMLNNFTAIPGSLCGLLGWRRPARWFQDRGGRRSRLARLLPPYRTLAVQWK